MVSGVFSIPLDAPAGTSKPAGSRGRGARLPLPEFIGGSENVLVSAAAEALLSSPDKYNPLVFVGPTGVGKSHLALGLVERWKHTQGEGRCIVTTGADFARAYAAAVDTDSVSDLRDKYLAAPLVFIDDLHELAGKRAAQEELLRLVDGLVSRSRRVVATARAMPTEIPQLAEGLASRLSAGLCVPLSPPGILARRAILARLAAQRAFPLAEPSLKLLSERCEGTVPQLQHALIELARQHSGDAPLDSQSVQDYLARQSAGQRPSLKSISAAVARYFDLKPAEMRGPSRRTGVVQARSLAMYLSRRLTDESLEQVGKQFGGRDHTTVLHACRKTESLLESDAETGHVVEELIHLISTH